MDTYVKILTDADHAPIKSETLENIRVPDGFEVAYHIYMAEESESPVVAEYVDTTTEHGKKMFRMTIAELIERVERKPEHYCIASLRAEIEQWMDNVINAEVQVYYLMSHG